MKEGIHFQNSVPDRLYLDSDPEYHLSMHISISYLLLFHIDNRALTIFRRYVVLRLGVDRTASYLHSCNWSAGFQDLRVCQEAGYLPPPFSPLTCTPWFVCYHFWYLYRCGTVRVNPPGPTFCTKMKLFSGQLHRRPDLNSGDRFETSIPILDHTTVGPSGGSRLPRRSLSKPESL